MIRRGIGERITGNSKSYFISKYKKIEDITTEKGHCYFKKGILILYLAEIKLFQNKNVGKERVQTTFP